MLNNFTETPGHMVFYARRLPTVASTQSSFCETRSATKRKRRSEGNAPDPPSFANSMCLIISSFVTVGRALWTARIKSLYALRSHHEGYVNLMRPQKCQLCRKWNKVME